MYLAPGQTFFSTISYTRSQDTRLDQLQEMKTAATFYVHASLPIPSIVMYIAIAYSYIYTRAGEDALRRELRTYTYRDSPESRGEDCGLRTKSQTVRTVATTTTMTAIATPAIINIFFAVEVMARCMHREFVAQMDEGVLKGVA